MRFEGTLDIGAPRERVWAFLTDPRQVTACAPDVQSLEVTDPTHFRVAVRTGVGAVRATFALNVEFTELVPPERAGVRARGQAPGSAVDMKNALELAANGDHTTMRWSSDVIVSGMIASVGARLIQGAADKTTRQVFACVKQRLEGERAGSESSA